MKHKSTLIDPLWKERRDFQIHIENQTNDGNWTTKRPLIVLTFVINSIWNDNIQLIIINYHRANKQSPYKTSMVSTDLARKLSDENNRINSLKRIRIARKEYSDQKPWSSRLIESNLQVIRITRIKTKEFKRIVVQGNWRIHRKMHLD